MPGYEVVQIQPDTTNPTLDLVWFQNLDRECHAMKVGHGLQLGDFVISESVFSKISDGSILRSSGTYFGKELNKMAGS